MSELERVESERVAKDLRERKEVRRDLGSGINSHVHRAIDELVVPSDYPAALTTMKWWRKKERTLQTIAVNEERLFSMSHMSKGEMINLAALMTIAQIRGDRVQYLYCVRRILGTLGESGRGRQSIKEIVMGATQKISESVQMQRMKRVTVGRHGEEKKDLVEEGSQEEEDRAT